MDEICKVAHCSAVNMSFFLEDGTETDGLDGYLVQVFIPLDKRADIDRNDESRREVTEIIDAALTLTEG
mgnify:CR=1 FL=1|tara:strand:+ start:11080 stop:11286 length:207 start_codon:yes stop_codon:yes gene_type:complete